MLHPKLFTLLPDQTDVRLPGMVETMIADRIEECLVERKGENHYLPELPH